MLAEKTTRLAHVMPFLSCSSSRFRHHPLLQSSLLFCLRLVRSPSLKPTHRKYKSTQKGMSGKVLQKFYNVAILGATGPVGTGLVEAFTSNARFKTNVRFLYRKESAQSKKKLINSFESLGAQGFPINQKDKNSIIQALEGTDLVLSALGGSGLENGQELLFIDAAVAAGVRRFIPSFWAFEVAPAFREANPIMGVAYDTIQYIETKHPSLEWSAIACGTFLEYLLESPFGIDTEKFIAPVLGDGNFKISSATIRGVSDLTSNLIHLPETKNSFVTIAGHTFTWNDLISAAEKTYGRTFHKEHYDIKRLTEKSKNSSDGMEKLAWDCFAWYLDGGVDLEAKALDKLNPHLVAGTKLETLEEYAKARASQKS